MTTTGPVERVVLTHLQIPFKEPFRISVGEVTIKDAILVAVETQSAIGLGESSPMAVGFGYSPDTPEGCWHDLATCLAPALLGQSFATTEDINQLTSTWRASRFAVAGVETALWDLLGQAHHATIAELLGASDAHHAGSRVRAGGRDLSQHRRAHQDRGEPPRSWLSPRQAQDSARR